jgi:hypothetical protein
VAELGLHLEELVDREELAGRATLRLSQYSTAVRDKNTQMQIWLGKNRLGQSDKQEVQHEGAQAAQVVFYGECKPKTWEEEQNG